jgi:S-adenosylmethionine decarboxylase
MIVGTEWLIEATGCQAARLRDERLVRGILDAVISDLGLTTLDSIWHKFEGEGGVTGLIALTESHLACHTYPEHATATFNLYCCRTRPEWDWELKLKAALDARNVSVTRVERGDTAMADDGNAEGSSDISNIKFEIMGGQQ